MMSCREVIVLANDHLDHRLSMGQRIGLRMHLAMCQHCRRYLRQLRATLRALTQVRQTEPPIAADDEAKLVELFRNRAGPRKPD